MGQIARAAAKLILVGLLTAKCTFIEAPGWEPEDRVTCEEANLRLEYLECRRVLKQAGPDGIRGTQDDWPFEYYCAHVQRGGILEIDTECIWDAVTCDEAAECLGW